MIQGFHFCQSCPSRKRTRGRTDATPAPCLLPLNLFLTISQSGASQIDFLSHLSPLLGQGQHRPFEGLPSRGPGQSHQPTTGNTTEFDTQHHAAVPRVRDATGPTTCAFTRNAWTSFAFGTMPSPDELRPCREPCFCLRRASPWGSQTRVTCAAAART